MNQTRKEVKACGDFILDSKGTWRCFLMPSISLLFKSAKKLKPTASKNQPQPNQRFVFCFQGELAFFSAVVSHIFGQKWPGDWSLQFWTFSTAGNVSRTAEEYWSICCCCCNKKKVNFVWASGNNWWQQSRQQQDSYFASFLRCLCCYLGASSIPFFTSASCRILYWCRIRGVTVKKSLQ